MSRFLLAVVSVGLALGSARGQDMPLSQILIEGEDWQEVKPGEKGPPETRGKALKSRKGVGYRLLGTQGLIRIERANQPPEELKVPGLFLPSGFTLWPDESTLVVGDAKSKFLWAFRIEADGWLTCEDRYYTLRVRPGETASGVASLTVDRVGRLYAATPLGVQIFDPTGRLSGVLSHPASGPIDEIHFRGDILWLRTGPRVFTRKLRAEGL